MQFLRVLHRPRVPTLFTVVELQRGMEQTAQRQADFERLQKEYRNLEINRKAYADESHQVLRRQQGVIEKLRKDNEALKAELALEARHKNRAATQAQQAELNRLQDQADTYTQKMEVEARNLKVMMDQITLMRQKILHQRRNMGGVNASKENQQMIQKQIRILENRLDKALIKFNEALAHNKQLRETIDNLRQERVVFDNIYRKLEKELHEKKKKMADIIEMSNLAYEQRDASQMDIAAIEQTNRREAEEFEQQMAELARVIEADKKKMGNSKNDGRMDMGGEDENKQKKRAHKGAWGMAKDKVNIQVSMERVQNFEEAFIKIKEATGIADIDELVRTFIKNEDQNFSLFNYVNEQTNEVEKLEEQIQALREEEHKYTQESGDDVNQHKQLLKELEVRLQSTESMAEKYESKCSDAQKSINSLKIGIQSIFNKMECNSSTLMSEIMQDSTVTEANMMQYLGMIEQRTNEILHAYALIGTDGKRSKPPTPAGQPAAAQSAAQAGGRASTPQTMLNILGLGPPTPMGQDAIQINPPNLEDYSSEDESEDDDDDARPLTREELKMKTLKGLHRRQVNNTGKSKGGRPKKIPGMK